MNNLPFQPGQIIVALCDSEFNTPIRPQFFEGDYGVITKTSLNGFGEHQYAVRFVDKQEDLAVFPHEFAPVDIAFA